MEVDERLIEIYMDIGGLDKQIEELVEVMFVYLYYCGGKVNSQQCFVYVISR